MNSLGYQDFDLLSRATASMLTDLGISFTSSHLSPDSLSNNNLFPLCFPAIKSRSCSKRHRDRHLAPDLGSLSFIKSSMHFVEWLESLSSGWFASLLVMYPLGRWSRRMQSKSSHKFSGQDGPIPMNDRRASVPATSSLTLSQSEARHVIISATVRNLWLGNSSKWSIIVFMQRARMSSRPCRFANSSTVGRFWSDNLKSIQLLKLQLCFLSTTYNPYSHWN